MIRLRNVQIVLYGNKLFDSLHRSITLRIYKLGTTNNVRAWSWLLDIIGFRAGLCRVIVCDAVFKDSN